MPDQPPLHLAEPASPLLLDQDRVQAAAEASTYVGHIERYTALAARAAERVCDEPLAFHTSFTAYLKPLGVSERLCTARSHTSCLAACAMRAPTPQGARMLHRARVRHHAPSSSPGTQGVGCELSYL